MKDSIALVLTGALALLMLVVAVNLPMGTPEDREGALQAENDALRIAISEARGAIVDARIELREEKACGAQVVDAGIHIDEAEVILRRAIEKARVGE